MWLLWPSEDDTSRHPNMEVGEPRRPQPQTENYRQLRNVASGRKRLPQGEAQQLVIPYQMVSPVGSVYSQTVTESYQSEPNGGRGATGSAQFCDMEPECGLLVQCKCCISCPFFYRLYLLSMYMGGTCAFFICGVRGRLAGGASFYRVELGLFHSSHQLSYPPDSPLTF